MRCLDRNCAYKEHWMEYNLETNVNQKHKLFKQKKRRKSIKKTMYELTLYHQLDVPNVDLTTKKHRDVCTRASERCINPI